MLAAVQLTEEVYKGQNQNLNSGMLALKPKSQARRSYITPRAGLWPFGEEMSNVSVRESRSHLINVKIDRQSNKCFFPLQRGKAIRF